MVALSSSEASDHHLYVLCYLHLDISRPPQNQNSFLGGSKIQGSNNKRVVTVILASFINDILYSGGIMSFALYTLPLLCHYSLVHIRALKY